MAHRSALRPFVVGLFASMWITMVAPGGLADEAPAMREERPPWPRYHGQTSDPTRGSSRIDGAHATVALPPALQGDVVRHDLVIQNERAVPLNLTRVTSCKGCVLDGYTRRIPPGGEGRITIVLLTDSRGGQTIRGPVIAETDDDARPRITVDVSMEVKEFAALAPYRVWLKGRAGEPIIATCIVTPNERYPFEITGIRQGRGQGYDLAYDLIERDGRPAYRITLTNERTTPGPYQDVLYVQTTHPERPEFKIRVEGRIDPAS